MNVLCYYQHPIPALRVLQNVMGRKYIIMRQDYKDYKIGPNCIFKNPKILYICQKGKKPEGNVDSA